MIHLNDVNLPLFGHQQRMWPPMPEEKTTHQGTVDSRITIETGPSLRLAGTPAGDPTDAELEVLELRTQAVLILSSIRQDSKVIRDRLERAGRTDPIEHVTGRGAIDSAGDIAEELIRDLDEIIPEIAGISS